MTNDSSEFLENLNAISESAFPKHCKTCGAHYNSAEDFIKSTHTLPGKRSIKSTTDEYDRPVLELYRNCICGSTLMDFFSDRRDRTPEGERRRARFEKLLVILEAHGIPRNIGRIELLKVLHGEKSQLINDLGLFRPSNKAS